MSTAIIPFGPLAVDQATFRNPGVISARNVVPQTGSYGPLKNLVAKSNALTAACKGAVSARDTTNSVYVYAADQTKLYQLGSGDTFTDISKAGSYTGPGTDDQWEFAVWNRNNKIIATSFVDAVQSRQIGAATGTKFADMITSTLTPKARHIGIINNFVVLGNTNDATDGNVPNRVWWSGFGDETDFDPSASTQCDYEDLATGGTVQRIIGGTDYGLVFQTNMVRSMRYVGAGLVFEFYPLNYAPGTPIPSSIIAHKGSVYYISEDGFFTLTAGEAIPIGSAQVDRKFWGEFDVANKRYVSAAVDPIKKLIVWAYPGSGSSSMSANKLLMYKYDEGKWAEGELETELLLSTETTGYTLDALDAAFGTDIDDTAVYSQSFDSDLWKGGSFRFGAFATNHQLGYFNGSILAGSIDTGDIQPVNGARYQITNVRPLIDGGDVNVSVASRTRLKDTVSYSSAVGMNTDGLCPVRIEGRYNRIRSSISASTTWQHFQGLELEFGLEGER